jgi:uncharacterized phiE125 gp8 family phage protein
MIVTTLAEPAAEPVGLAEAKAFLRITGAGEDGLVGELVAAARAAIEDAVGLALISRTIPILRLRGGRARRTMRRVWPARS